MLNLYDPAKTLETLRAMKEYYEELVKVEVKKAVDKVQDASDKERKQLSKEIIDFVTELRLNTWYEAQIDICQLIIKEGYKPEQIIIHAQDELKKRRGEDKILLDYGKGVGLRKK